MPRLAVSIRRKELIMPLTLKGFSLFFKIKNRIKKEIMPEIEVAKARPPIFSGNISKEFKIIFRTKARAATFVGVTVSLRLKKQDCNILVAP